VSRWSGLCLPVAPDRGDEDARGQPHAECQDVVVRAGDDRVLSGRAPRPGAGGVVGVHRARRNSGVPAGPAWAANLATGGEHQAGAAALRWLSPRAGADLLPLAFGGHDQCRAGRPGTGWHWPCQGLAVRADARHGGRAPARVRPGAAAP